MELDRQIAEMMGLDWHEPCYRHDAMGDVLACKVHGMDCDINIFYQQPSYSTSISDAWILVEWLRAKGWAFCLITGTEEYPGATAIFNRLEFDDDRRFEFSAPNTEEAMAICQAALKLKDTE